MTLFPIGTKVKHNRAPKSGMIECGLFKVGDLVAEAKYDGIRTMTSLKKRSKKRSQEDTEDSPTKATKKRSMGRPTAATGKSQQAPDRVQTTGATVGVGEDEADADIPWFLRKYTEKYPFGNVHMALRVGPLVLENGVENSKGGAFIGLKENPVLYAPRYSANTKCLALSEDPKRQLR